MQFQERFREGMSVCILKRTVGVGVCRSCWSRVRAGLQRKRFVRILLGWFWKSLYSEGPHVFIIICVQIYCPAEAPAARRRVACQRNQEGYLTDADSTDICVGWNRSSPKNTRSIQSACQVPLDQWWKKRFRVSLYFKRGDCTWIIYQIDMANQNLWHHQPSKWLMWQVKSARNSCISVKLHQLHVDVFRMQKACGNVATV